MRPEPRLAADHLASASETAGDLLPPAGRRGFEPTEPLAGGAAVTAVGDGAAPVVGYGTLGGIAFDAGVGGGALALSAAHVLGPDAGKLVIEPFGGPPPLLDAVTILVRGSSTAAPPLDVVAPAPFAPAVALAAAVSWVATVAAEVEDPSRFGQRTTPVPDAARTDAEEIRVVAPTPALPFAGRLVAPSTAWTYRRLATTGVLDQALTRDRPNGGNLAGKRVWTSAATYRRGQKVMVGAELFPPVQDEFGAAGHFVVAHLFPLASPGAVVRRLLEPGTTPEPADGKACFRGFPAPAKAGQPAIFPLVVGPFRWAADRRGVWEGTLPTGAPSGAVALRLPETTTRLLVPPSTRVELEVFHRGAGLTATPLAASGMQLEPAPTTVGPDRLQILAVAGIEIVEVRLATDGGPGLVLGVTASRARPAAPVAPLAYTGGFDLVATAARGSWGVVVFAQRLDLTPFPNPDPLAAAARPAGVTETANVSEGPAATAELLVDAVFEVT